MPPLNLEEEVRDLLTVQPCSLGPSQQRDILCPNASSTAPITDSSILSTKHPTTLSNESSVTKGATCSTYNWMKCWVSDLLTGQPCPNHNNVSYSDQAATFFPSPNVPHHISDHQRQRSHLHLAEEQMPEPQTLTVLIREKEIPGPTGPVCNNWRERHQQRHRTHLHWFEKKMGRWQCKDTSTA